MRDYLRQSVHRRIATTTNYSLRQFESPKDEGFLEALSIYARNTPPGLKTDTNEICYWLENYGRHSPDRLYAFGFYCNEKPVGFGQLTYFAADRLLVIDYLVLDSPHRKYNAFFEFSEHLREAVQDLGLDIDYAVAEVGYMNQCDAPGEEARLLIRLLKLVGFRVIKAPYYQPMLAHGNYESQMRAALMLYVPSEISTIKRETYVRLVQTLYYRHYQRWYDIYPQHRQDYQRHLDGLLEMIQEGVAASPQVELNGYRESLDGKEKTVIFDNQAMRSVRLAVLLLLLSTAGLTVTARLSGESISKIVLAYWVSLLGFVALVALFFPDTRAVLRALLDTTVKAFRRR